VQTVTDADPVLQDAMAPKSGSSAGSSSSPLTFDGTSFESGNLGDVKLISVNPLEYDLNIRPDTLNGRHRIWFYFSVRGARAGQKVLFNILGYSKTKSLFRDGMAPVVSTSRRPYWERIPPTSAYYYRSPRHDKQYVLSFPFCFDRANETYYFAFCFPYTYSYLQQVLFTLEQKALPYVRRECLARSLQARRLDLLTISSPANLKLDAAFMAAGGYVGGYTGSAAPAAASAAAAAAAARQKHVILVTGRVHPGETPASFVMHGLLLFLTSEQPQARELREAALLKVVPMLNPDGVTSAASLTPRLGASRDL
jgi:hypothetical protein